MSQPFIGEIRMFAGNFAPAGWMFCDGSVLPITGNETLFALIGTTYGGDGITTFALPNLQSRVPIHVGPGFALGQTGGVETVTLTTSQIPAHSHVPQANTNAGTQTGPGSGVWANSSLGQFDNTNPPDSPMAVGALGLAGGSQPHDNMVPFLVVNFILSLFGVFPSQT
jgi:microcystin-dependent protein